MRLSSILTIKIQFLINYFNTSDTNTLNTKHLQNTKILTFPHFLLSPNTKPQQSAPKATKNPIILLSLQVVCALARVGHMRIYT